MATTDPVATLSKFIMSEREESENGHVFSQDIRHTTLNRDGILMETIHFIFEEGGVVVVQFDFTVNHSMKLHDYRKEYTSLTDAVKGFLRFYEENRLCHECGKLAPVGKDCPDCVLFGLWATYHGSSNTCAICQEPVWRLRLSCGHHFHMTCINAMNPDNGVKCPVCRRELNAYEMEYIFLEESSEE